MDPLRRKPEKPKLRAFMSGAIGDVQAILKTFLRQIKSWHIYLDRLVPNIRPCATVPRTEILFTTSLYTHPLITPIKSISTSQAAHKLL